MSERKDAFVYLLKTAADDTVCSVHDTLAGAEAQRWRQLGGPSEYYVQQWVVHRETAPEPDCGRVLVGPPLDVVSETAPEPRCKHGYKLNGCELGYPGCVCADEAMLQP